MLRHLKKNPALWTPRNRSQVFGPMALDQSNEFYRSLIFCSMMTEGAGRPGFFNGPAIGGTPLSIASGTPVWAQSKYGPALAFDGSTVSRTQVTNTPAIGALSALTIIMGGFLNALPGGSSWDFTKQGLCNIQVQTSVLGGTWQVALVTSITGLLIARMGGPGPPLGEVEIAGTWADGQPLTGYSRDSTGIASNATSNGSGTVTPALMTIGGDVSSEMVNGQVGYVIGLNRALSQPEIVDLWNNPMQLLRPLSRRNVTGAVPVPPGAAGQAIVVVMG